MAWNSLEGVVLDTVRVNDRTSIAHVYTDHCGLISVAVSQGRSAGARQQRSMFLPLSLIAMEARQQSGRDVCIVRDVQRTHDLTALYADPARNAIAMFITELLTRTIIEREANAALYNYLTTAVRLLATIDRGVANFHICFLYHLGRFIGIEPAIDTYHEGWWFDMQGGVFIAQGEGRPHVLPPPQAAALQLISRMTFANLAHFRLTREQRNEILDTVLTYYRLHHSTLGTLRSPAILKQLFT